MPYDPYNIFGNSWGANAAAAGAGAAGVGLRQSMTTQPYSMPTSPLAPGVGGMYGTGSYMGTMAAHSPSSSPYSVGLAPNMAGSPTMLPTPMGNVPVQMIPNGFGGYSYIPVGPAGAGGMGGGFQPTYPNPNPQSSPLGLSWGGGAPMDLFGGGGGGGMGAPSLGGGPVQPRQPFGAVGGNQSQNTFAGRSLGQQTSPNGFLAQAGGAQNMQSQEAGRANQAATIAAGNSYAAGVVPNLNMNPANMSGVWTPPMTGFQPWNGQGNGSGPSNYAPMAPNQAASMVNYPDSMTGGVQMYTGAGGQSVYTNPGQIGLPGAPGTQPAPGQQPGSTGFSYPSAFGQGGSYYSTPPMGGPLGQTAQTLMGFGGGAQGGGGILGGGISNAPVQGSQQWRDQSGMPAGNYSILGGGGGAGGFQGGQFGGPNGGMPAAGAPSGVPGFPGMPSSNGPFSNQNPLGVGANLLTNEIMRREQLLNTAQGQYQNAIGTITGSPVASGINALLSDLLANPYPYSSDANKQRLIGQAERRVGGATEASKATAKQTAAEQGLRGGETAGMTAAAQFKGSAALADAITDIEREMGIARTQERTAASGMLAQGGQTLAQSIFGPQMEAASFFERRSNPEIQALVQLLGQDMALKVAQAIAAQGQGASGSALAFGNPLQSVVLNNLL